MPTCNAGLASRSIVLDVCMAVLSVNMQVFLKSIPAGGRKLERCWLKLISMGPKSESMWVKPVSKYGKPD